MTDALKNLVIPDAQGVRQYLKEHPSIAVAHIRELEKELEFIGASKPIVIAFGRDTFGLLKKHLNKNAYATLVQVTHYSHQVKKEKYRTEVLEKLSESRVPA